jgi:hypothetical protein
MSGERGAGERGARVEVPGGQGVQVGDHNKHDNQFIQLIQNYFEAGAQAPSASPTGPVVVGDMP